MRIALTIWSNRISPVFDVAQNLLLINIDKGEETVRSYLSLAEMTPQLKIEILKKNSVEVVLCGAISRFLLGLLTASGIKVEPWISGDIEEVIQAVLQDKISDPRYRMPGCCRLRGNGMHHERRRKRGN